MRAGSVRYLARLTTAALLALALPRASIAQDPASSSAWRLSASAGAARILSGHPHTRTGQVSPTLGLAVDRALGRRFALGLAWIATWYPGDFGAEQRQTVAVTASAFPLPGLELTAGLGPGIASLVTVEGPPPNGAGDVNIDVFEGESALGLLGRVGYHVPLSGRLRVGPTLSAVTHRVRGQTMTFAALDLRIAVLAR